LAAKLLGQPPQSIGDKATLDQEDYVPEKEPSARRADVVPYPMSSGRISLEKSSNPAPGQRLLPIVCSSPIGL
jgi:hypothetical protein